jgi:uncharacterized protein YecT (DUF1311 family)
MLLSAGTFTVEQGANVIHIAAQCLNEHLDIPGSTNVFDHFSDGVLVTRTIGNERETIKLSEAVNRGWVSPKGQDSFREIGIEVNPTELEKGATFQVEVRDDAPQFLATGESQVNDVNRLLENGGNVIKNADQIVENFISDQLPQWRSFLGDSYPDDLDQLRVNLKQALIWALRDNQSENGNEALRVLGKQFGYEVGLPLMDDSHDVIDRVELLLGRRLTQEDRSLLEKMRGGALPGSSQFYQDCASIKAVPKSQGGGFSVFFRGSVFNFSFLEDACKTLQQMDDPPRHLILQSRLFNIDDRGLIDNRGILSGILADHGFNYVVDPQFFAEHGLPQKPKTVIVFGSEDPEKGREINKTIFGGQPVAALPEWISRIKNSIEGGNVHCVTNKEELDNALVLASKDGVLPWVIGHNENGHFISESGDPVELDELHYPSVLVSCNLLASPVRAPLALRTTQDLDLQAIMGAIGDALRNDQTSGDAYGDFLNVVWSNYNQDQVRRNNMVKAGILVVAPSGVITIAYATSHLQPSPSGNPETTRSRNDRPESSSAASSEEQAAAAEQDLNNAWLDLTPQQRNAIRQDERNWIKMKERIPVDDPRRAEEVRKREQYLRLYRRYQANTLSPATTSSLTALDQAEQSLNQVYRHLWAGLNRAQRAALKAEEIVWINMKESIPTNDPRRLQAIKTRIDYLQSYQPDRPAASPTPTTSIATALDQAEQSLNQVYRQLWTGLNKAQRASLKAEEIGWINMKESISTNDPRRLQVIEARIDYLRSWRQSH